MSCPKTYTLVVPKGEDFSATFLMCHEIVVGETTTIATTPATLLVYPLSRSLTEGDTLQFSEVDENGTSWLSPALLTVEADAPQGSRELTLSAPRSTIFTKRQSLIGAPIDLTGYTGESKVRQRFSDIAALINFGVDFPNIGECRIRASKTATSIAPNAEPDALPPCGERQNAEAYTASVWRKRYHWDLELTIGGLTTRRFEGACFVTKEATYE